MVGNLKLFQAIRSTDCIRRVGCSFVEIDCFVKWVFWIISVALVNQGSDVMFTYVVKEDEEP